MSEEKVNAKLEQAGGKIKEAFGKVTGDKSLETEGKVDQAASKIKEIAVDAKDAVKGFVKGLKQDK